MNNDPDKVLDSDNGLISAALTIYAREILALDGDVKLYDRAMELSYKFRDMDPTYKYE